jgi:hypothetical protein
MDQFHRQRNIRIAEIIMRYFKILLIAIFIIFIAASCSKKPYIKISYQLPPSTDVLKSKKVFFNFKDMRSEKGIFSETARSKFRSFTGDFSLSLIAGDGDSFSSGEFDLPSLFQKAFSKRLEQMGAETFFEARRKYTCIEIVLKTFHLGLIDRTWVARISYQASLIKNNKVLSTQSINGNAKRYKLTGNRDAEKLLGELFTDVVNKVDIFGLFHHRSLLDTSI